MDYQITITPDMLLIMPVIAVVLQKLKDIPLLANYTPYFPFVSVALGIGFAYLLKIPSPVIVGIMAGLVTSGGYDALKGTQDTTSTAVVPPKT